MLDLPQEDIGKLFVDLKAAVVTAFHTDIYLELEKEQFDKN